MHLVWDFFQNEILGMKWLNRLIGSGLELLGLDTSGRVGGSIQFFIYDTIKIMVLLGRFYYNRNKQPAFFLLINWKDRRMMNSYKEEKNVIEN